MKTKACLSVLIVSMFLLASFAALAPVDAADSNDVNKGVGTLFVNAESAAGDGWIEGTDYEYDADTRVLTLNGGSYSVAEDYPAINLIDAPEAVSICLAGDVILTSVVGIIGKGLVVITGNGSLTIQCTSEAFKGIGDLTLTAHKDSSTEFAVTGSVQVHSLTIKSGATLDIKIENDVSPIKVHDVTVYGHLFIDNASNKYAIDAEDAIYVRGGIMCIESINYCTYADLCISEESKNTTFIYGHSVDGRPFNGISSPAGVNTYCSDDGYTWEGGATTKKYGKVGSKPTSPFKLNQTEGGTISFFDKKITESYLFLNNEPVVLTADANDGFRFEEWSDGSIDYPNHLVYTSATDNTYSATFVSSAITHIVTFVVEGKTTQTQLVKDGECVGKPADPTVSGKMFQYWYSQNTGEQWDFNTPVKGGLTLIAKFVDTLAPVDKYAPESGTIDIAIPVGTPSVIVHFTDGSKLYVGDTQSIQGKTVTFSVKEKGVSDKFDIVVAESGTPITGVDIQVTLPYKVTKGEPAAYYYPDDGSAKVDMKATINDDGTVTFITTHNSVYGIEYSSEPVTPTSSGTDLSMLPVFGVFALIVIGIIALVAKRE